MREKGLYTSNTAMEREMWMSVPRPLDSGGVSECDYTIKSC